LDRIKIYNDRRFDIGIRLPNNTERVIPRNGYTLLTRDELEFAASLAPNLFKDEKQIRLEDRAIAIELGFVQNENLPLFNEAEIKKQLSARIAVMKAWLDGITEPYLLAEVFDVARQMDLPASKLKVLQEKFPDRPLIEPDIEP
jgi:hypothetical protein